MKPIIAHRTTIDAEREFDLWLTFVGHPTDPMNRHFRPASALAPAEAEIRHLAYQLWLAEGQPAGRELEHWLEAKARLSQHPASITTQAARRRRHPFSGMPAPVGRPHHN
jgi:hypothetical protein